MSRVDLTGFMWTDKVDERGRIQYQKEMPEIPETGWRTPTEFPNLSAAKAICVDVETYDPELTDSGPGWARGRGHIVGLAIGVPNGGRWYFPIKHEVEPEHNMKADVLGWAKSVLSDLRPKIGANILYDAGWLRQEGIELGGMWYDIQNAESLLHSESPTVSLEALGQKYVGTGKASNHLYEWCADYYGGSATERQRKNIYRSPPRLVGPYAESDADLPLKIMSIQWALLDKFGLMDLFAMESKLTRVLMEIRFRGVGIRTERIDEMDNKLTQQIKLIDSKLKEASGEEVNVNASASIAKAFDALGVAYNRTEKGNPSFTQSWLENNESQLAQLIVQRRKAAKLRDVFIRSYLQNHHVDGVVYGQFHQLKKDKHGARSGRLSSSTPNLQNIPVRTAEGKAIRAAFAPRFGGLWRRFDYSQIEYRLLAHHAVGAGAEEIRKEYAANPKTDYHQATIELIKKITGMDLDRKAAKTINFGFIYGMAEHTLQVRLNLSEQLAKSLFSSYHKSVPFARATMNYCMELVERDGYITTVLNRRSQFEFFTSRYKKNKPLSKEEALLSYGNDIERAYKHKALNRRLQGGAADIMKQAMVQLYEDGLFDQVGFPSLTVHDELDFEDEEPDKNEKFFKEIQHVMATCVPCNVPLMVDAETGPSWGECA